MSDPFRSGFDRDGFALARQLFSRREARRYCGHFMALHHGGRRPHEVAGADSQARDPLRRYPRMMQMHRWDPVSLEWLLDARICDRLLALLGGQPFAVQTMCYFKPPGSPGASPAPGQLLPAGQSGHLRRRVACARPRRRGQRLPAGGSGKPPLADPVYNRRRHGAEFHRHHCAAAAGHLATPRADGTGRRAVLQRLAGSRQQPQPHGPPVPALAHRALHPGRGMPGGRVLPPGPGHGWHPATARSEQGRRPVRPVGRRPQRATGDPDDGAAPSQAAHANDHRNTHASTIRWSACAACGRPDPGTPSGGPGCRDHTPGTQLLPRPLLAGSRVEAAQISRRSGWSSACPNSIP